MCGFAGYLTPSTMNQAAFILQSMGNAIKHRGPDDKGIWYDNNAGIGLTHQRLSIVDLSAAGHQPMTSHSGRFVLVFNGEIYNHLTLRADLTSDAVNWHGHSDTETLLSAFETWGIEATLQKTIGMFAIALWDKKDKVLTLARDRMGEKPLYYGYQNNTLLFGSELKALKAHPDFKNDINRDVINLYLRHCYIPAPYSIYNNIYKLLPGTYIQFPLSEVLNATTHRTPKAYWQLSDAVIKGIETPFKGSDTEAIAALDKQLKQTIKLQMLADVPLGTFLSGGIDSSTIVALMQSQVTKQIKTFSIGFTESTYNEATYAKEVAKHLKTDHTELYVTPVDCQQVIPNLGSMYDEPFADSSQLPTFLVAKMAREHVTVSLSGDAGDELFCGYNRYLLANHWHKFAKIPYSLRQTLGGILNSVSPVYWDALFKQLDKIISVPANASQKIHKLASRLQTVNIEQDLYYSLVSEITNPEILLLNTTEPGSWLTDTGLKLSFNNPLLDMMYLDGMTYLPDDILVKVDRAAMAVSLETRVPFLDHNIIEFAYSLPMHLKLRKGQTKWLLRQVLYQYVPKHLIERPKAGFGIPLSEWLRGPLKDWAESLLNETHLKNEGYFNVDFVHCLWKEHCSGKKNHATLLWNILMFQAWLQSQ